LELNDTKTGAAAIRNLRLSYYTR